MQKVGGMTFCNSRSRDMAMDEEDIVRLVTAPNPAVAHIWQQALANANIECRIGGEYLGTGFGNVPGVGAELWVRRDDVSRAEEVLKNGEAISEADTEALPGS
jgi:hypothetical protein